MSTPADDRGPLPAEAATFTSASAYDWYLGGKNSSTSDQSIAEQIATIIPAKAMAQVNRAFLGRVVNYLIDCGVRQFLDLGAGFPTADSVHEIAAARLPQSWVMYVDVDTSVVHRTRTVLDGSHNAHVIAGDIRDPGGILTHPLVRQFLGFDEPIGLLMISVLHFIPDSDDPADLIAQYQGVLPRCSFLALSHLSDETTTADMRARVHACKELYATTGGSLTSRTRADITSWLTNMDLVPPGIVPISQWHAEKPSPPGDHDLLIGAVGCSRP